MDEPLWETPYDEVFVGQESLILEVEKGDFGSLLYTVTRQIIILSCRNSAAD